MIPFTKSYRITALVLALAVAQLPFAEARVTPSHGADAVSVQDEIKIGQQTAAEESKKLPLLAENDPVTQYVQRLGANLSSHAPGYKWPYSFRVVNQKEINAFALPGGPIFVNLGTIQAADNEAELAGVMAHEISHVVQRHATRAYTKQQEASTPLSILGALLGNSTLGQLAQGAISFGAGSYFLGNSRKAESEADLLGTDIMYDSGYNPKAMAEFFKKLEATGGANSSQFFSDHPNPGNRYEAVTREASTLSTKAYTADLGQFTNIKQLVSGKQPLTAQQIAQQQQQQQQQQPGQGSSGNIAQSSIYPSGRFASFRHDVYDISYPDNWQVYGDRSSNVTFAPQEGVSQNAVAFGAIIQEFQPESASDSLDQASHELVASLRQSNADLRQIGHDENIRINGLPGKSIAMLGTSPLQRNGQAVAERDWLVTVKQRNGDLLYMVFVSPDPDFRSLQPAFQQMLNSLRLR